ncbi:MAG: hypothetical protein JO199_09505 [Candidatus Eremiobacteraeota bacterium]|nr:hypothetical protein [Candidatus Eremiobacteraeota bacterium]
MRGLLAGIVLAAGARFLPAGAGEPANYTLSPGPPGTIVENQVVYLTGEAMHGQWRAVVSKKAVGHGGGNTFYQWYLSIYAIDDTTYRLKYRSPGNGGPLSKVEQVSGGDKMWFPIGDLHIVGAAELVQPGVQQLVVESHEMAADCGGATVSIFSASPGGQIVPAAVATNGCRLKASIVHGTGNVLDTLQLTGPFYAPNAALCCPTKADATAKLSYANGAWVEAPKYYPLSIGKFAPE